MSEKFILPIRPDRYLFNGPSNCGMYVVKGILSAYQLDIYPDPRNYHPKNFLAKKFGWTFVGGLIETLEKFGVKSKKRFARGINDERKIESLKSHLRIGGPVILNVGSCYKTKDRWKAKIIPHWITVWGYNEVDFFVYDSSVPLNKQNPYVPIGNRRIDHHDLIKYWGAAHWFKLKGIIGRRYLYLTTEKIIPSLINK